MNTFIRELRWNATLRRSIRSQCSTTYSQYRHFFESGRPPRIHRAVGVQVHPAFKSTTSSLQLPSLVPRISNEVRKSLSVSASVSASADLEDDEKSESGVELGIDSIDCDDGDEVAFDHSVDLKQDELAHLRIRLYPLEDNENERFHRIFDATSIQQVFDIVEEESEGSPKVASQALVTIWDLQKLLFKISEQFEPERDFFDKPSFLEKVTSHPTFIEKILKPVVENCESLPDDPLLACLLCLQKLNFNLRSPECEKIVDECLRRRETLSLPSVSRFCVCMRSESLYGNFIVAKFQPLLWQYIDGMKSDFEVRLIAIALRNCLKIVSDALIDKFRQKIFELKEDTSSWESMTVCKVFLLLYAAKDIGMDNKDVFETIGEAMVCRIPKLQLLDLLTLQKFMELGNLQPYPLVEALVQRMLRIVQEGVSNLHVPRLDLLANIAPYLRTVQQRKQIEAVLTEYLDNHNFELASHILFTLLRWTKTRDMSLYHRFWDKASEMIESKEKKGTLDRRILRLGKDYVNFCYAFSFVFKNANFEFTLKRYLYKLMENYYKAVQPSLLVPSDFAKAFSFLIGRATLNDAIFYESQLLKTLDDFAPQFRAFDLAIIGKGLDSVIMNLFNTKPRSVKYYDRIIEICTILEEQCPRILMSSESTVEDLIAIYKLLLVTRRVKGDFPLINAVIQRILECEVRDQKVIRDMLPALVTGLYNYPEVNHRVADFIWSYKEKGISVDVIEKFIYHSYAMGWEPDGLNDVMQYCSDDLTQNWKKLSFSGLLQASIGLCYFHHLSSELVQNIFSVNFLDQVDTELSTTYSGPQHASRLRQSMMELNRAVCIDMPDVNLPWFHGKYCEEMLALNPIPETYLHREVRSVLGKIVGDETAVQENMCSPYYYKLDYLIEFDEKHRPIKKQGRQTKRFFQKFRGGSAEVSRKVAVLLLAPFSFTRNVRDMRGHFKLRRRHLEVLGYDVVEIDPVYWNSMFMSDNAMRLNFLESKLYANAS